MDPTQLDELRLALGSVLGRSILERRADQFGDGRRRVAAGSLCGGKTDGNGLGELRLVQLQLVLFLLRGLVHHRGHLAATERNGLRRGVSHRQVADVPAALRQRALDHGALRVLTVLLLTEKTHLDLAKLVFVKFVAVFCSYA